jgi:hypothetical protein
MRQLSGRSSRSIGQLVASVAEDAFALAVVGFTLLGVGGVAYKALRPDGWISTVLARLWDKSPGLVWLAGFAVATITLVAKHYYDRDPHLGKRGNIVAYTFIALGLFFFFKLVITGSL